MISSEKIYKISVLFSVIILIGFQRLFVFLHFTENAFLYRAFVAFLAMALAIIVLLKTRNQTRIKAYFKVATKYLIVYGIIITLSISYSVLLYEYSAKEMLAALTPYLYIFFCYPIIYVFYKDKQIEQFSKTVSRIVILILLIKTICWVLFMLNGTVLFQDLLFEYGNWSRGGQLRMDAGYLYGFAFAFYLSFSMENNKSTRYKIAVLFLLLFMIFITKFRFQLIALVLTFLITYFVSSDSGNKYRNRVIIFTIILFIFIASGAFEKIVSSFSINSEYGGSTYARVLTISHYWELMKEQYGIIGLGLLNISNANAYSMMYLSTEWGTASQYYLEDIGIIGAFFKFGILMIPLYGMLFYEGIRICTKAVRTRTRNYIFLVAVVSYMIISCIALDIFDLQRALNVPFYLALISFFEGQQKKEKNEKVLKYYLVLKRNYLIKQGLKT